MIPWMLVALGVAEAGQLTVLSEGEGDKALLEYRLDGPVTQDVQVAVDIAVTVTHNGTTQSVAVPTYTMDMRMQGRQGDDGLIATRWRCTGIAVATDGLDADTAALGASMRKLRRAKGTMTFRPDGIVLTQESNLGDLLGSDGSLDSSSFDLARTVVALPPIPVGVGASWVWSEAVPAQGLTIPQETTYTVTSMQGRRVGLDIRVVQEIPSGTEIAEGDGVSLAVREFSGQGLGQNELDLGALVGPSAESTVDVVMDVTGTSMGISVEMTQAMRVHVTVEAD